MNNNLYFINHKFIKINKDKFNFNFIVSYWGLGIGGWGLGFGDWGLGIGPNPQSPIPNPQSPIPKQSIKYF